MKFTFRKTLKFVLTIKFVEIAKKFKSNWKAHSLQITTNLKKIYD